MTTDRRQFLASAAGLAAAQKLSANDKLTYGLIAAGGRGRYLSRYFTQLGAQCLAVCDAYEPNMEAALKDTPGAKKFIEHEALLAMPGIDFVVCAGPDHWHVPHLIDSIKAGKDVYTEKPLARTLQDGARAVKTVKASGKIVQVGMQRRSAPSLRDAKKIIDDGKLGRITMTKAQWNWNTSKPLNNAPLDGELHWNRFLGSAPKRAVEPMRWRSWRVFKDYAGGNMTDQGTHLMDVVLWFTGKGVPKSAVAQGYIAKMTGAEHPDVFSAVFDHGDMLTTWTLDYANAYENGWSILFMGDEATMRLDDAGVTVWKEPWHQNREPIVEMKAPVPMEPHIQNFLDCIKSRQQPNCPVEIAQAAVAGPHLANIAMFEGRKAKLAADLVTIS
ncbi:MAG TPA: Gfo/Idh/MocA family oxidoreductase [Bryobacteraceae bacterium]|nr:Gfo/Idh/MocA family oxidoreductase [Bryobacteraceae bacterium]HPT27834.1 Gfo/Idh/MocA family oxidoreductase [Bryobacteraceae bacterium]